MNNFKILRRILAVAIFTSTFSTESSTKGSAQSNTCAEPLAGSCTTTPTYFSLKVYEVGLCTSNPMADGAPSLDKSTCKLVYNNSNGEDTGDVVSGSPELSSQYITQPTAGVYRYSYAVVGDTFGLAAKHLVRQGVTAATDNTTYYSQTLNPETNPSAAGPQQIYSVRVRTFSSAIACTNGSNKTSKGGVESKGMNGRLVKAIATGDGYSYTLATQNSGNIGNGTAICADSDRIVAISDGNSPVTIGSGQQGLNLRILVNSQSASVFVNPARVVSGFGFGNGAFALTFDPL